MAGFWARHGGAVAACCGCLALGVAGGVLLSQFGWWPAPEVRRAFAAWEDYGKNGPAYRGERPVQHLRPNRFPPDQAGALVPDPSRVQPGVTLLTGLFGDEMGAMLLGRDGSMVHRYPIDLFDHMPEGRQKYPFHGLIHGAHVYPNGDLILNLDGEGLMRVDACGEVLWQNEDRTHHSVDVAEDGTIWSPRYVNAYDEPRLFPSTFGFDQVASYDPETGERLATIDLVALLVDSGMQGLALASRPHTGDIMHLNDVEVLDRSMASAFPLFEAGDLMLSSRHLNQIWVLDGETHALRWWRAGPFHSPHDPDFQPDGTITLLDNRPSGADLRQTADLGPMGGSRILSLDPSSFEHQTVYGTGENSTFYTPYRGKHEVLENGNLLIAETDAGRAFEVDPSTGEVVWSYVNAFDETHNGWVMGAYRYPESHGEAAASAACLAFDQQS